MVQILAASNTLTASGIRDHKKGFTRSISEIHARQIAPAVNAEIQLSFQIENGVAARPLI
jgi:hypothetical protein